jgi:hypothetical protein
MSKKFTNTDPYDASVDQMWAMICNQDYWTAKYESLGASNVRFTQFTADDDTLTLVNERDVPADLPSFAKKIIGDTNHLTHTERWTRSGDSAACTIEIQVKNLPGGTTGTMELNPSGSGSTWSADFDIKVGIPMVGGKLEGLLKDETGSNFRQEKSFNDQWLATNG